MDGNTLNTNTLYTITEPWVVSNIIQIGGGPDGWLVKINWKTGEIEYGPNYTPDKAAEIFWQAIGRRATK